MAICIEGLYSQSLLQPLEAVPLSNQGVVLLKTGEIIEGKIKNTTATRGITRVTLITSSDGEMEFWPNEMEEFMIVMNKAVKLQYFNERGSSLTKLLSQNQPGAVPSDYITYRNVKMKSGNEVLLQLLNPDFAATFEVYYDPFAAKTASMEGEYLRLTGDKHRSFLVSNEGQAPMKVKKGNYKRSFHQMFGSCQIMHEKKPKWNDLGRHIWTFENACQEVGIVEG